MAKVGFYYPLKKEAVFLQSKPSFDFSTTHILSIQAPLEKLPCQLSVNFFGLMGPNGPMPFQDTFLALHRARFGDLVLKDYLDCFNHRLLSLFYRAWSKNRLYIGFENAIKHGPSKDTGANILKSFHGEMVFFPTNVLPKNFGCFFSGILSQKPASALGLKQILACFLNLPVNIKKNVGKWIIISKEEKTKIATKKQENYNSLADQAMLGGRFCSHATYFQVSIGPLTLGQFEKLLPGGDLINQVWQIICYYAPSHLKCQIQLILKASQVPMCAVKIMGGGQLGLNTWLQRKVCTLDKKDTLLHSFSAT
jgi:type VI secretion system protein ImpH